MSTDRELLELAAKAVNYRVVGSIVNPDGDVIGLTCKAPGQNLPRFGFCPLTDDGDAFRLQIRLRMLIETDFYSTLANGIGQHYDSLLNDAEKQAAARRAIVRAAAEIGKAMP